jgi:hypothetical protein
MILSSQVKKLYNMLHGRCKKGKQKMVLVGFQEFRSKGRYDKIIGESGAK